MGSYVVDHLADSGGFAFEVVWVEALPGDGLAEAYVEGSVSHFEHLVGEVNHLGIELDAEALSHPCEAIEERRVLRVEEDGYDVAAVLDGLRHEVLVPRQVVDSAVAHLS